MAGHATVTSPTGDQAERRFERIIGNSDALESVLDQVEQVAPTDSTVLIEGETGTGKELIAHGIHNAGQRFGHPFIKLNCAAIPLDLLESELFGHERGAFTGAIAQKIGRFEMADKGTLFLDEVGDIPPALQPKLLRVLQEQEFERLGSGRTHKVDVRLVAATNRDLAKMVARGQFRGDLYYRLNVFPILLPALRERREDIPALVTREASRQHSSGNHGCLSVVSVAWQHPRVAEFGGTRGDPFAGRCAPEPTSQKANRADDPQSATLSSFPLIDDLGRLSSRFDFGDTGAGRLDRRWTAWRSGEAGIKTNDTTCQNEKIGNLAADPARRNRRVRHGTGGCSDLKALLPFHCGVAWGGRGRAPATDEVQRLVLNAPLLPGSNLNQQIVNKTAYRRKDSLRASHARRTFPETERWLKIKAIALIVQSRIFSSLVLQITDSHCQLSERAGLEDVFPFLKRLMAHSATLDRRERSLVENCFASARISSKYFASTTLWYSRNVSSAGSRAPALAIMDKSGPLAQRFDASLPM